jgi:drug/metabolite transporter (DMT)-like permease
MASRALLRGQLYALASMVIWSSNYILGRLLRDAVTPATISTFRGVVACIMMGAWLTAVRGWPRLDRGLAVPFLTAGFLGIFASQYLTYLALHWTLASTATILNAASPIVSAAMAVAAGLTPYSGELFGGLAISGAGTVLITVLGASPGGGFSVDPGALLIIASTVTWGFYNLAVQRLGRLLPPLAVAEGAMLAGLPFLFAALAVEHPPHLLASVRAHLPALLWLALGPSAAAYVCWNIAVRDLGVGHAMAFNNTLPVFGIVLGAAVLGERVTTVEVLASALIIGGILLTMRSHPGVAAREAPGEGSDP